MARFGQGLIQGLINPSYAENLNAAGMMAGSLAGRQEEAQREEAEKARVAQTLSTLINDQSPQRIRQGAAGLLQTNPEAAQMLMQRAGQLSSQMDQLLPIVPQAQKTANDMRARLAQTVETARTERETRDKEQLRQEAFTKFVAAKGNPVLAGLAQAGVITPSNFKNFLDEEDKPVNLSEGAILVNAETGEVIASNPKGDLVAKDYSLTQAEVETYESIINKNADIKDALKDPESGNLFGFQVWDAKTDTDKQRIIIDKAEKIRTSNPKLSKEEAIRQAAGIVSRPKNVPSNWVIMTDTEGNRAWANPKNPSEYVEI